MGRDAALEERAEALSVTSGSDPARCPQRYWHACAAARVNDNPSCYSACHCYPQGFHCSPRQVDSGSKRCYDFVRTLFGIL